MKIERFVAFTQPRTNNKAKVLRFIKPLVKFSDHSKRFLFMKGEEVLK